MSRHQFISDCALKTRLVFWKDRRDCERYYCRRSEGTPEEERHNIDLAMEYGSNVYFEGQEDLERFLNEYASAWLP